MKRLIALKKMISERRVGFLVDEIMTGTHQFSPGCGPQGEFPFEFQISWGNTHFKNFLNPLGPEFFTTSLKGKVTVGELVTNAPCEGTLELKYFTEAKLRYTFDFQDLEGTVYHYRGEKIDLRPWNLHRTHTTLYGTVTNKKTGLEISRSTAYFRLKTIPAFLLSMRLG